MSRVDVGELGHNSAFQLTTWQERPFTGVAFERTDGGALIYEAHYRDGSWHGPRRTWYESGQLKSEEYHYKGLRHGPVRQWDEGGQLRLEASYRFQIVLSRKRWEADGTLSETFTLTPDHPAYARLLRVKKRRGDPPVVTESSFR